MPTSLVVNAGSTSHKLALLELTGQGRLPYLWQAQVDWGSQAGLLRWRWGEDSWQQDTLSLHHGRRDALADWLAPMLSTLAARFPVTAVGHRIVHGGERFQRSQWIGQDQLTALQALVPLAPLHNQPALDTVELLLKLCPDIPQAGVFDTAFHHAIPEAASTYGLPMAWRRQGIRRYGFHGINHSHMARIMAAATGNPALRLVSLHLGGGCSASAVRGLRCQDTSMGFTPLEGLVMGSRCGSVDPAILLHQLRHGWDPDSLEQVLQHQSGLAGLSGISGDMRQVRQAAAQGHAQARLALEVFFTALIRAVGSAVAVLQGVDVVALSGGIGEHDQALQQDLLAHLHWLGVRPARPPLRPGGNCWRLSGAGPVEMWVVQADEEGAIAREVAGLLKNRPPAAP
ncbi:MAG: acetate/propionate family kinase [Cyanobacteria bacterium MAG CAR2_bin_4]|nr:acetate/propionate family kinase [Cyanobacteria bacterium MAG CAR2_bin_4]